MKGSAIVYLAACTRSPLAEMSTSVEKNNKAPDARWVAGPRASKWPFPVMNSRRGQIRVSFAYEPLCIKDSELLPCVRASSTLLLNAVEVFFELLGLRLEVLLHCR